MPTAAPREDIRVRNDVRDHVDGDCAERADVDGVILSLRFDADGADGDRPKAVIG